MSRKFPKMKFVAVFALTTLIFVIGILIGSFITNQKLNKLDELEQGLKSDVLDLETQFLIFNEDPCYIDLAPLTNQLYDVGSRLDYMENRLGEDNKDIIAIKNYYFLLELRHWLIIKKDSEKCSNKRIPIIYFYANSKSCKSCKEQGFILDYIKRKYNNVYIYSFDIDLGGSSLNGIKKIYNVESAPTIIIGDEAYHQFMTKDTIETVLSEYGMTATTEE